MNLDEKTLQLIKGLDGIHRTGKLARFRGSSNLLKQAAGRPGVRAGSIAALLLAGATGVVVLIRKAREKGKAQTIASIHNAVARASKSHNLTNAEKLKVRATGTVAIAKIKRNVR